MIEKRATWGDVEVDSYIKDAEGTVWRIVAQDSNRCSDIRLTPWFRAKSRAGEFVTLKPKAPDAPVTMLVLDDEDRISLLRDKLGAKVLATKDNATGGITCPAWPSGGASGFPLDVFRDHLFLGHGMYATDIKTFAKLVEAHEAAHDPDSPTGKHLVHTHI